MPALREVASDQQNDGFRTFIQVDRDAATRLGVSMQAVQDTLYDSFGQRQISTIFGQANQYRVMLEADPVWQPDPDSLRTAARAGRQRRAGAADSAFATIHGAPSRRSVITHQEQFPSVTLSFNLAPGYSLGRRGGAIAATKDDRPAGDHLRQLLGRRRRIPEVRSPPNRG